MAVDTGSESSDMETHLSLIRQAQANEPAAWELVFTIYAPLIKCWARGNGVSCPHEVDNVCQDVFAKLIKSLRSFEKRETGGSFRGWLRVITRNHIYTNRLGESKVIAIGGSKWNHQINQIPFEGRSANSIFDSSSTDSSDEKTVIFRRIMDWIDSHYSSKQRKAFKRVVIDQRPAREVAEDLDLTVNVVYQCKSRILARIREVFQELV